MQKLYAETKATKQSNPCGCGEASAPQGLLTPRYKRKVNLQYPYNMDKGARMMMFLGLHHDSDGGTSIQKLFTTPFRSLTAEWTEQLAPVLTGVRRAHRNEELPTLEQFADALDNLERAIDQSTVPDITIQALLSSRPDDAIVEAAKRVAEITTPEGRVLPGIMLPFLPVRTDEEYAAIGNLFEDKDFLEVCGGITVTQYYTAPREIFTAAQRALFPLANELGVMRYLKRAVNPIYNDVNDQWYCHGQCENSQGNNCDGNVASSDFCPVVSP